MAGLIGNHAQQLARGLSNVNLAHDALAKRQASLTTSTGATPTPSYDSEQAVSTLLSAYSSANLSLATANSEALASISAMVAAQSSYEAELSAGRTPTFVVPGAIGSSTTTIPAAANTQSTVRASGPSSASLSAASSSVSSTGGNGAAARFNAKFGILSLLGVFAVGIVTV